MADRVLRDHSEPCGHFTPGRVHATSGATTWWSCPEGRCPGGREVTDTEIREAAYQVWLADQRALIAEALATETADLESWEASDG